MIGWHGVCSVVASLLGGSLASDSERVAPFRRSVFFSEYFFLCLSGFPFFLFSGVSSRRSLASEGCRGEAPAARASEMRRDTSDTLGFSFSCIPFFALSQSREAVTEGIGRDTRVRESLDACCSVTGLTFHRSHEFEL